MKPSDDELVRVESDAELDGVPIVVRKACRVCAADHVEFLVRRLPSHDCTGCKRATVWWTVTDCGPPDGCYCIAIREGRLFRLKPDEQPATHQRQREREEA